MKYTTQSEYGLICLLDVMSMSQGQPVSLSRIAKKESLSLPYLEKIFGKLVRGGIVKSIRGAHGGFILARDPAQITCREVIDSLEGNTLDVFCSSGVRESIVCTHLSHCGLQQVWVGLKKTIDNYFDSITLASLSQDHRAMQTGPEINTLQVPT